MKKNPVSLQAQDFALRLSKLRESKEISACTMSYDLGHSRSYINGIELQKYLPSFTEFIEICNYLNVTPNDLFLPTSDSPPLEISPTQLLAILLPLCDELNPRQVSYLYYLLRDFLP
mgnify:FL=1